MGFSLFGKSSSSSSTSTTEYNTDNSNVGVSGGGLALHGDNNVVTDGGAVERALSFASEGERLFYNALNQIGSQSAAQATSVLQAATDSIERVSVAKTEGEAGRLVKILIGIAVAIVGAGVVVYVVRVKPWK